MVKVTDKDYYLDGFADQICKGIADRVQKRKQDILMIMDGREGSGKTNASICMAYRIADLTGRKFDVNNVFFSLENLIKFAGTTKEQVIVWDESALGGLANDWTNVNQKKLNAMLMVCRKLRHVFIFNIPRFWRLSQVILERSLCLMHIYEDKEEKPGNFMFIGGEFVEHLYNDYKRTKRANYWRHKKVHGHFTFAMPKLIDEVEYERRKDEAIRSLAKVSQNKVPTLKEIQTEVETRVTQNMKKEGFSIEDIAKALNYSTRTIYKRKPSEKEQIEVDVVPNLN